MNKTIITGSRDNGNGTSLPVVAICGRVSDQSGEVVPQGADPGNAERSMLKRITGPLSRLDYPSHEAVKDGGKTIELYDIPKEDREAVLQELYLFEPCPRLDDTLFDLHEGRPFQVRDFLVVREDDSNFVVSPYYLHSGGTILDWIRLGRLEPDTDDELEDGSNNNNDNGEEA